MHGLRRMMLGTAVFLLLLPLSGEADAPSDNLEHNRSLLEKWRRDPEHYDMLRRNLLTFLALPEEAQKRLRRLDQDLHDEDSATSVRLQRVLERYADWLERLPEADRQRIQQEADPKKRVQLIRALRERQWIQRLPKAVREELEKLPAEQQRGRITELRQEERKRREAWRVAMRNWAALTQPQPAFTHLKDLAPEVQTFVHESLYPMLTPQEKNRLSQAEGRNPLFLRTLVELADKHPIKLPGPSTGPSKFEQLPPEVQARLKKAKDWPADTVKQAEGKWPEYAEGVMEFVRLNKLGPLPKQLGPCRPAEFSPSIRKFLDEKLIPVLGTDDVASLRKAEGRWPWYARRMLQLARKHGLPVPGMSLPGPRDQWNRYRTTPAAKAEALPEVPLRTLLEFAHSDLSTEEQANLPALWVTDPASRSKVNQMYLDRNPAILKQLRQADQKAQQKKQAGVKK